MNRIKLWKTLLAAMVFVAGASGLWAQATSPIYPTNGSVCIPYNLSLQWQPMINAISYDVLVSKTPDFDQAQLVVDTTGVLANSLAVSLEPNRFYYWKVTTVYAEGTAPSGTFGFYTKSLTPAPTSPVNGAACLPRSVRLDWNATPNSDGYSVQASESPNFNTLIISRSGILRLFDTIPLPKNGTTYYWRVRSNVDGCETDWSAPFSFTTKPAAPTLDIPVDSAFGGTLFASVPFSTRFAWRPVSGSSLYNIQVSETPNFAVSTTQDLADTSLVLSFGSTMNKQYFWRVRSQVNGCWSDYSAARKFKTPYDSTRLVFPAANAQCLPTQSLLRWNRMGAFKYRIQVARDANFTPGSLTYNAVVADTTFLTDFTDGSLSYYWRVRAEDSLNVGFWSESRMFVTTFNPPVVPAGATSVPLNYQLTWNEFNTQAVYSVQVSTTPTFGSTIVNSTNITTPSHNITLPEYNKTYYWRVKQQIGACESAWSLPVTIKTQLAPIMGLTPPDSATKVNVRPTFSWTTMPNAVGYDIVVATDPLFKNVVQFENDVASNKVIFPEFKELTTYYWHVRATEGPGLEGAWSKTYVFTTGIRDIGEVTLIYPADNADKIPATSVNFKWNRVPTATNYKFQLASNETMTVMILDTNLTVAGTSTIDSLAVANLAPGTRYFWRVQASNSYHTSEWSEVYSFLTTPLPPTVKATLLTPENGKTDVPINILLTWNEVPLIEGYELQVSSSASFEEGTFEFNSTHVWNEFKFITELDTNKKYYWRVRGWNDGGYAPWSDVFSFTTGTKLSVKDVENAFKASVSPNPAASSANLEFELGMGGNVSIDIYDSRGTRVAVAFNGALEAGRRFIPLDLNGLASGSYQIAIVSGDVRQIVTIIVKK